MRRKIVLLAAPPALCWAARMVCMRLDIGLAALNAPPGMPARPVFWAAWAPVFLMPGIAGFLTLGSGDARRYGAMRLLACALALYNLWPLPAAGRLWLNMSSLIGFAAVAASLLCARRFRRIDRRAGLCMAVFSAWAVFELYLTVGFAVLN
ncbi:MAG: tryptophan-rich sensory protein [Oscillospiraceae bacterium]|nr:tryptophan-rich sensory protein [Oscillospiraceae bacterium]